MKPDILEISIGRNDTNNQIKHYLLVSMIEKSRNNDEKEIKCFINNSIGYSNFLACLKVYLEYGINLRKGAFDFMKK